jgi:hypothetical protein
MRSPSFAVLTQPRVRQQDELVCTNPAPGNLRDAGLARRPKPAALRDEHLEKSRVLHPLHPGSSARLALPAAGHGSASVSQSRTTGPGGTGPWSRIPSASSRRS